jgi:1,2-diacylglycerol 3-alpha-glucosyltransferase
MMRKTVLITSNAYFPNIGGVENSLRYLAQSYKKLGYNVIVLVSDLSPNDEKLPFKEEQGGICIYRYPTYSHFTGLKKLLRGYFSAKSAYNLLRKVNNSNNISLTISRFHTATLLAKFAKLPNVTYLVPGVVKNQNSGDNLVTRSGLGRLKLNLSKLIHHTIQKYAFKMCDNIFVFSENMKSQVKDVLKEPVNTPIVKPGVDTSIFCPSNDKAILKAQYNIPQNKTILLTVGRFVKAKGFDLVVDAVSNLPDCHLVMVGDGEGLEEITRQIEENELSASITLTGSKQDTAPYYQIADIFLMSSVYEPLGQTILEAMASGLPIVAFKGQAVTTATEELLLDNEAIYTNNVSSEGLVTAVNQLLSNPLLMAQLSQRVREKSQNDFSWDTLASKLIDFKK